ALCSICPTTSGSSRKAATMTASRTAMSSRSAIALPLRSRVAGPGPPGRRPARALGSRLAGLGRGLRPVRRHAGGQHPAAARRPVTGLARLLRPGPRLRHPRGEHEVLAERVTLEPVRQQQRAQVRVALEDHPEHLIRLPLVPVRAAEDTGDARQARETYE